VTLRKTAALLAAFGIMVGLIGSGVGAQFTDQVIGHENINVGTFSCGITTATNGAVFGNVDGQGYAHSVTYTAPTIMSSAAGSAPFTFTVQNTGSIPDMLTVSTSSVSSPFSIINAPFAPVLLGSGASYAYNTGVQWTELQQANAGLSGTVTWTVTCGEANGGGAGFSTGYFAVNNGGAQFAAGTWCRSTSPIASTPVVGSGTATQSISGGAVHLAITNSGLYADNGFYVPLGPLGSLTSLSIAATGDPVTANLYLDTSGDGQFFSWSGDCLSGLAGDDYGSGPSGTALTINDTSSFQIFTHAGGTYTIADLKAGALAGVSLTTQVAVWIGITTGSGQSLSSTVTAAP
jgi:hypothetical protein